MSRVDGEEIELLHILVVSIVLMHRLNMKDFFLNVVGGCAFLLLFCVGYEA